MELQNSPGLSIEPLSERGEAIAIANTAGRIIEGGLPGLESVIQGGNLNGFPDAARSLLTSFWVALAASGGARPSMPVVGTILGWDFVENVDPPPAGYAQTGAGNRVYVWNGDDWFFGTWFGRWFRDPTHNPVLEPSALQDSQAIAVPSGTLFNGAYWEAGTVLDPAGTIIVPDSRPSNNGTTRERPTTNGPSFTGTATHGPANGATPAGANGGAQTLASGVEPVYWLGAFGLIWFWMRRRK